jgi:Uma2 family endonuclease
MKLRTRPEITAKRNGFVTFDDFCAFVHDGQKADLIDGVIYMASPENTDAADLFTWLITLMYDFVEHFDLGKIYGSRVACKLDDKNSPEPDILVLLKKHLHRVKRGHILGAADLAIEIVSPESAERDYVKKVRLYEKFGFREYWIIDEELEKVTLFRQGASGKFREMKLRSGAFHSGVLLGFYLRPEWLWPESRPRKADVLSQLLADAK